MTEDGVCFALALLSAGISVEIIVNSRRINDDAELFGWGVFCFAVLLMITNGYPLWTSYFGPSSSP